LVRWVAGVLAQWAPASRTLPYLPHIAFMAVVLLVLLSVPETVSGSRRHPIRLSAAVRSPRFRGVVAPMAPWVFAAPVLSSPPRGARLERQTLARETRSECVEAALTLARSGRGARVARAAAVAPAIALSSTLSSRKPECRSVAGAAAR
jgi:hypothetical protein